ncbi:MAG: sulfur oxidation c-type cytochrome SoxX [Halothiobacillaceae bacterium]|nr:sulfur oxidation c-type cytochrome SoxX [Halothiobacillaceae bacterium]
MRNITGLVATTVSAVALAGSLALATPAMAAEAKKDAKPLTPAEEGKKIAFDRGQGNCLACHNIKGGELPGTIGPPLVAMKMRFPDKKALFDILWDPRPTRGEGTIMPPLGAHGILTKDQIEKVVEYLYTL